MYDIKENRQNINTDSPVEVPRTKTSKCGSTDHLRMTNKRCPLFVNMLHTTTPLKLNCHTNETDELNPYKKTKSNVSQNINTNSPNINKKSFVSESNLNVFALFINQYIF